MTEERPSRSLWRWWPRIRITLWAVLAVVLLQLYVVHLSVVRGHSMEPTIRDREWLVVSRLPYVFHKPREGDVVILRDPLGAEDGVRFLVKRVVAVPGDELEIRGGRLYVNGGQVAEAYASGAIENGDFGPMDIPDGRYFVMGDNRRMNASEDSRVFGPVSASRIDGKVEGVIWPPGFAQAFLATNERS